MRTQNLAIVFTDVKGFAEAAARGTLEQNQAQVEKLRALLGPVFEAFHGRVIKSVSDSFLVVFESPTLAVLASAAAQDEVWKHNQTAKERLDLRLAVTAGEVGLEANDVLGEPVAAAAAVRDGSAPGDVTLTEAVWLIVNRAEVKAEPSGRHGELELFRVPRSLSGPPFGGQGMTKVPPAPTGELGGALTASALQAIKSPRTSRFIGLGAAGLAIIGIAVVMAKLTGGPPPLQKAIDDVRTAPAAELSNKVIAAQALIALEKEATHRDYWYGKLQAVQDDENAGAYFRSAARAGYAPAEDGLIDLLKHRKCNVRIGAITAITELRLTRAKPALQELADRGGADDTERVLFFGCNSRAAAGEALSALE